MKIKSFTLLLLILLITGCTSTIKTTNESTIGSITEKYWKLKSIEGKEVVFKENQEREIFITLRMNDKTVTGFAGCNTLSGEYTLEGNNRISFKNIAVTMKICPNVGNDERKLLKVLELAKNYSLTNDVLTLSSDKKVSLAVFEAVYM